MGSTGCYGGETGFHGYYLHVVLHGSRRVELNPGEPKPRRLQNADVGAFLYLVAVI